MKKKTINLIFDPTKKLDRLVFMNSMASVVQILHTDPEVNVIQIQIAMGGKVKKYYDVKLK